MGILKNIVKKIKKLFCIDSGDDLIENQIINFIGMGESLKSPLDPERETALLKLLELGDESVKTDLIEHNLRLVVFVAKKFIPTGHNIDDLISIGSIGLIKAVNSYKLDKNIKLATYATRCIENEILMYLRKTARQKNEVSLDEPIKKSSEGTELYLSDVLSGMDSETMLKEIEDNIEHKLLLESIKKLSPREKQIMMLRFGLIDGEEQTQKDVADKLSISQSYISRLEKKIIDRLKKEMIKKEA